MKTFVNSDILIKFMVDEKKLDEILANTGDLCLKRRAKLLISELNPQKKDRILDIGCGDGFYLYLLSNLGDFNLTGIDDNFLSIKAAKKQLNGKKINFVVGDIFKMPFEQKTFNKIISSEVLEHLPNDVDGLLTMKKVLKDDGLLFITVPNLKFPFFWDPINYILQNFFKTHIKSGFWAGVWNMHLRLYTNDGLKNVVKKAGFKIKKFEYVTHYGLPFNHYLTNIGFRIRTSDNVSEEVKKSMSKFEKNDKETWFTKVLRIINWFDKRNDKKFGPNVSTVGLFLVAQKK